MMSIPLLLASSSPRRFDLLRQVGFHPEVRIPEVDESQLLGEKPDAFVSRLALEKVHSIRSQVQHEEWLALGADTVLCLKVRSLASLLLSKKPLRCWCLYREKSMRFLRAIVCFIRKKSRK